MGSAVSLAVIDQINIAGGVCWFVAAENQSPVAGDGQLHDPFRAPLRGCSFQPGKRPAWPSG